LVGGYLSHAVIFDLIYS